jgi:hypothetical protein
MSTAIKDNLQAQLDSGVPVDELRPNLSLTTIRGAYIRAIHDMNKSFPGKFIKKGVELIGLHRITDAVFQAKAETLHQEGKLWAQTGNVRWVPLEQLQPNAPGAAQRAAPVFAMLPSGLDPDNDAPPAEDLHGLDDAELENAIEQSIGMTADGTADADRGVWTAHRSTANTHRSASAVPSAVIPIDCSMPPVFPEPEVRPPRKRGPRRPAGELQCRQAPPQGFSPLTP